jgi:(p)ppGpp synthase/HD superfamily hydrolase
MSGIEEALAIALTSHRGQQSKNGEAYILHPLRVMHGVESHSARIVSLLHDVVEDSPTTLADLQGAGFSSEIVSAVDALTKREGESYQAYLQRVNSNPLARQVKLADLSDNMDITRIPILEDHDLERLKRYRWAWTFLTESP